MAHITHAQLIPAARSSLAVAADTSDASSTEPVAAKAIAPGLLYMSLVVMNVRNNSPTIVFLPLRWLLH